MKREEVIKFAKDNPICFLSTVYKNTPYVRTIPVWFADDTGIYFEILSLKELSKHLRFNPQVEVCFISNIDEIDASYEMRLSGKLELITNEQIINEAYRSEPVQDEYLSQERKPNVEVYRLTHGDARLLQLKNQGINEEVIHHTLF